MKSPWNYIATAVRDRKLVCWKNECSDREKTSKQNFMHKIKQVKSKAACKNKERYVRTSLKLLKMAPAAPNSQDATAWLVENYAV